MIEKAKSIALHSVRYGESSLIAYVYTREFGRATFMVNSAYGKGKGAKKAVFFQPLSLLNTVFYKGKGMGRLKEVTPYYNLTTIPANARKRAIALFISEIIYKAIREEESNPFLFDYIELSIKTLDTMEKGVANFHLLFLAHLSKYLGFYPNGNYSEDTPYFDIKNGSFVNLQPAHPLFFSPQHSELLSLSLKTPFSKSDSIPLNGMQRAGFLDQIFKFYAYHLDSLHNINSLAILSQIFS
ncbi:MAG: DNA repair protein RecO [Bacteroidales bacterium]